MVDQIIVLVYLLGILALGLWSGRGIKNLQEYSVVNRQYPAVVIFATLAASFIGGGFSFGNAGKVYAFGIANIVILWGFSFKELLVATYIAPRVHHFSDQISVGGIMGINYGKGAQIITGMLGVLVCSGIVGAQVGAMGTVFEVFAGLPRGWGIAIGCGIVIAYTTVGGMRSIIMTDIIQFVLLAFALPLALVLGLRQIGGFGALEQAVPAGHLSLFNEMVSPIMLISLFLSLMVGETLVPPYVQRLLIGKNARQTAEGTLYSALFSIPFFAVTGMLGLVALAMDPNLGANAPLPHVIREVMPIGLRGLVIAGIVSIVMSSADSFLNASSVALINDVLTPLRGKELSDRQGLAIARLTTLVVGIIAVWFALSIENVLDILLFSYNFWAPVVLVPLVATFLGYKADPKTFFVSAFCGSVATIIWFWLLGNPQDIDALIIGVVANLITFVCMYRIQHLTESIESD